MRFEPAVLDRPHQSLELLTARARDQRDRRPLERRVSDLHEEITARTIGAMVLILGAVLMIQLAPAAHAKAASSAECAAGAGHREEVRA